MSEQTPPKAGPTANEVSTAQEPQEPKASETPQAPKITRIEKTYKPKDPRRVEAGKRLAAISKSAKEKKARDRKDHEDRDRPQGGEDRAEHEGGAPLLDWTIPMGGLVIAGVGALYYAYKNKQPADTKEEPPKVAKLRRVPTLDSFDD